MHIQAHLEGGIFFQIKLESLCSPADLVTAISSTVLILFLEVVFKCNFPHLFLPPFFLLSIYSVLMVPVMKAKMTQN